jgi:predicted metalloendopeptidase
MLRKSLRRLGTSAATIGWGCLGIVVGPVLSLSGGGLSSQLLAQRAAETRRAIVPANFDTTCAACQDFYRYVNGGWIRRTNLGWTGTGASTFGEVTSDGGQALERVILDAAAEMSAPPARSRAGQNIAQTVVGDSTLAGAKRLVGTFYNQCQASSAIEAAGIAPLAPWLARIDAIKTPATLMMTLAALDRDGIEAGLHLTADRDFRGTGRMLGKLDRDGLGLSDPAVYARSDSTARAMRATYTEHVANILTLLDMSHDAAVAEASRVVALEARLASDVLSDSARRDPHATFHPMTVAQLHHLAPAIAWDHYFETLGVPSLGSLNVARPSFVAALDTAVTGVPLVTWRAYLKLRLADAMVNAMTSSFAIEDGAFRNRLQGLPAVGGARNCMSETATRLSDAVGRLYVANTFGPAAKARALVMVQNLKVALRARLQAVTWMTPGTKTEALAKLAAMTVKVGYPDRWRDYTGLTLASNSFAQTEFDVMRFERRHDLARIGRAIDRTEWQMSPATVNAGYSPTDNDIVVPAAILVPPLFDSTADDASNYGAIGMIIGHEMTHAFDDKGRQFDARGQLRDWWSVADAREFTLRARQLVAQYASYIAVDTMHVNGWLTLGENIADLGGTLAAYDALQLALQARPDVSVDGFTPAQRFFVAFANMWRGKFRPDFIALHARTDPHAPLEWRVNGVLPNVPAFAGAFHCDVDAVLSPSRDHRVVIW